MKKQLSLLALTAICFTSILTGCGDNDDTSGMQGQQNGLFQGYRQPDRYFTFNRRADTGIDQYNRFGFDHQTRDTALSAQDAGGYAVYDRSLLAQTISQIAALNPNVNEVAVLVTDYEVLMAYDTTSQDREDVATQVKKTALSVVPAYFKVYVADNPGLIQDIERFEGLSPNEPNYAKSLDQTIEEMKKYPQGEKIDYDDEMLKDTRYDKADSHRGMTNNSRNNTKNKTSRTNKRGE